MNKISFKKPIPARWLRRSAIALALLTNPVHAVASQAAHAEARPTVAEELLVWEGRYLDTPASMHQLLSDLVEDARRALASADFPADEADRAKRTLQIIEKVLAKHHFVYPARDYVGPLRDALAPTTVDAVGRVGLANQHVNVERVELIRAATDATAFHIADCDLYSLLYVSIGQALDLPITMVDRPGANGQVGHDYVAWVFPDGRWLAWEGMSGSSRRPELRKPNPRALSERPMTIEEVRGFAHWMAAIAAERARNYAGMASELRASIELAPQLPETLNALAWLLATCPDPTVRDPSGAVAIAKRLAAHSADPEILDTIATAYASNGDWQLAQRLERIAVEIGDSETFRLRLKRFERCQPYIAPRPEERKLAPDLAAEEAVPDRCTDTPKRNDRR